jgi:hypothetical protein
MLGLHRQRRPHFRPGPPGCAYPEKFYDNVFTGEDIAGEKFTYVAVERTNFTTVRVYRLTVGPVNSPQARLRIEQPQVKPSNGLPSNSVEIFNQLFLGYVFLHPFNEVRRSFFASNLCSKINSLENVAQAFNFCVISTCFHAAFRNNNSKD